MENDTSSDDDTKCEAEVYVQVFGTLIFFVVWPFIVLDMKWFPLGRPAAALIGGTFMTIFHVVTQSEVYEVEGTMGNLQAIFLLVGMMLLSYYFDREGLLRIIALWIFGKNKPFKHILWKVCALAALLAAFITNDATCLVITPLIMTEFIKQGRDKRELLPLALGICTSANIGSSSTVFGNPQNAFIASAADIALIDFFIAMLPAAILGVCISVGLLHLVFFGVVFPEVPLPPLLQKLWPKHEEETEEAPKQEIALGELDVPPAGTLDEERASLALSYDQSKDPFKSSAIAKERELMYSQEKLNTSDSMHGVSKSRSRLSLRSRTRTPRPGSVVPSASNPAIGVPEIRVEEDRAPTAENGLKKEGTTEGAPEDIDDEYYDDEVVRVKSFKERTIREKLFAGWLLFISVLLVVLLAIPGPPDTDADFNLGLIPLGSGILTMLVDTILNRKYAYDAMLKIDWTVVLMFFGLFVWIRGFQNTCIPEIVVDELAPALNILTFGGVLLFTIFVLVCSQIFSNVPLTILIVDRLNDLCGDDECKGPLPGLLLAWVATVAGNFTMIGSITNLIVAEKCRSIAGYKFTFLRHIRFGLISCITVTFGALPIVYFLGRYAA